MSADYNKPVVGDTASDFAQFIRDNQAALARMHDGVTPANLVTGTKRWNSTNDYWEYWNGSAWAQLTSKYMIDVDTVDGRHAGGNSGLATTNGSGLVDQQPAAKGSANGVAGLDGGGKLAQEVDGGKITSGTVADARIASTIARDTEVTAAIASHVAAGDPHGQYFLESSVINDTQHGSRGGGSLHAAAVASGDAGFLTGADKLKLDDIESKATKGWEIIAQNASAINVAYVESSLPAGYSVFRLIIHAIQPVVDSNALYLRIKISNVLQTGSTFYADTGIRIGTGGAILALGQRAEFPLLAGAGISNAALANYKGEITAILHNAGGGYTTFFARGMHKDDSGKYWGTVSNCRTQGSTSPPSHIRLYFASGDINYSEYTLLGLKT